MLRSNPMLCCGGLPLKIALAVMITAGLYSSLACAQNSASGLMGAFSNMMNQAIQQQQLQQRYQQQQLYYQQQQQQQYLQQQQQQYQQQQQRGAAKEYEERREKARERAAARKREKDAALAAAREKERQDDEAKAKAAQEAQAKVEEEARRQAEEEKEKQQAALQKIRNQQILTLVGMSALGSGKEDITVLLAAHDTGRVVRNLEGDPVFVRAATVCFPFGALSVDTSTDGGRFTLDTLEKVKKKGGGGIIPVDCTPENFGQADLIVFSRNQLEEPELPPPAMKPVVDAIAQGAFIKFGIYAHATYIDEVEKRRQELEDQDQKRVAERKQFKEELMKRDENDISAIYVKVPALSICVNDASNGRLAQLLKGAKSPFSDLIAGETGQEQWRYTAGPDAIFLALKAHDCLAAIATTKVLRKVMQGLERDGILYDADGGSLRAAALTQ
jgi:chemotaxis protein histidine kinase CheA